MKYIPPHALLACTPHFEGCMLTASKWLGLAFAVSHILACALLDRYTSHLSLTHSWTQQAGLLIVSFKHLLHALLRALVHTKSLISTAEN